MVKDRQNLPPSMKDQMLIYATKGVFSLPDYSQEDRERIEKATRGQSENDLWSNYRYGCIGASNVGRVMRYMRNRGKSRRANPWRLAGVIIGNGRSLKHLPQIAHGNKMEPVARKKYAEHLRATGHLDVEVKECGMFFHPRDAYLEASPDGLVSCSCCGNGLVEIKCPSTAATERPSSRNEKCLKKDRRGRLHLKKTHPYYDQIQAQLAVTGRPWCDFFLYKSSGVFVERIEPDPEWLRSFQWDMKRFFWWFIVPVLVSRAVRFHTGKRPRRYGCPYCGEPSHHAAYCWCTCGLRCHACKHLGHKERVCISA